MKKFLAIFDFDHTVIHKNSDKVIEYLLPKHILQKPELLAVRHKWTTYMAEIFKLLPENGYNRDAVTKICQNFEPTEGMIDLFKYLSNIEADINILSDANTFMITTWLDYNLPDVKINEVISNPATWLGEILVVQPLQNQMECQSCSINLCKGSVLAGLLSRTQYNRVFYTGDGSNDYCPSQKLRPCDFVFPRKGFKLEKLLETDPIQAKVVCWENASVIKNEIDQV